MTKEGTYVTPYKVGLPCVLHVIMYAQRDSLTTPGCAYKPLMRAHMYRLPRRHARVFHVLLGSHHHSMEASPLVEYSFSLLLLIVIYSPNCCCLSVLLERY